MEYEVRSMASYETRNFVDNIIRLLERKGMTRQEFARRLDVRPSYVTKILSGSENFTVEDDAENGGHSRLSGRDWSQADAARNR